MQAPDIVEAIREALKRKGTNPSRFAKENGFSVNAVRYILEGRPPSSRRLAEVCAALDLQFYVGPPRLPQGTQVSAKQLADELERLALEARRLADDQAVEPTQIDQRQPVRLSPAIRAAGSGRSWRRRRRRSYQRIPWLQPVLATGQAPDAGEARRDRGPR